MLIKSIDHIRFKQVEQDPPKKGVFGRVSGEDLTRLARALQRARQGYAPAEQGKNLEKLWFMQTPACRKMNQDQSLLTCKAFERALKRQKKASRRKKLVRIAIAPQRHLLRAAIRMASYRRVMPRRGQADRDDGDSDEGDEGEGSPIDRSPLSLLSPLPCFSRFSSPSVPDSSQAVVVCSFALVCCVKGSSVPSTIKKKTAPHHLAKCCGCRLEKDTEHVLLRKYRAAICPSSRL